MKTCNNCHAQLPDDASFCTACGAKTAAQPQQSEPQPKAQPDTQLQQQPPVQNQYQEPPVQPAAPNPYDHTAEFSEEEVHDNKIFALAVYALDFIGIIIALLAKSSDNSAYLRFHIKQQLTLTICKVLVGFVTGVFCWTCIVPVAGIAALAVLEVAQIICFINTCRNKSVEPILVCKFGFLK